MKNLILISLLFCIIVSASAGCKEKHKVTAKDLDMTNVKDYHDKKKRFFDFMRPIIIDENKKILSLRKALLAAQKNNNRKAFVTKTAKSYNVAWDAEEENWDKLLERVDSVALEVALAQSAIESAWGQSRFAQLGNNFFGQWCYQKNCGIVPENRDKGTSHEVTRFNSVNDSVRSYLKIINTVRAYAPLRKIRKLRRDAGKIPNAKAQAGGLIRYSQRRKKYVRSVRAMIQADKNLMMGI